MEQKMQPTCACPGLESELTMIDKLANEQMVRRMRHRNVVPTVASSIFAGDSRRLGKNASQCPHDQSHIIHNACYFERIAILGKNSRGGCDSSDGGGYERERF